MKKNTYFTIGLTVLWFVFIVSFSIAIPIIFRGFYYWQIEVLDIVGSSGYDYLTIKGAYDEMMNFCLGLSQHFSCGSLPFSQEGYAHFVDVRNLFMLDVGLLISSFIGLIVSGILQKTKRFMDACLAHHQASCNASKCILGLIVVVVLFTIPDFNYAFTVFHRIFFPGKENWLFDPKTDPIINILPEQFFANCAICIGIVLFSLCFFFILKDALQIQRPTQTKNH